MEKVIEAARHLVATSKETTALHECVDALESALVEYDGGAPASAKPARARKGSK